MTDGTGSRPGSGNSEDPSHFPEILELLRGRDCSFRVTEHEPISSAQEAAAVRDTPTTMGAKAIVFKTDGDFRLFVLRASDRIRSRLVRKELGVSRTRFANRKELLELTSCEPGAVPPFGRPILDLDLYLDPALLENDEIVFTPGRRDRSVFLATGDYLRIAETAKVFRFAEPPE
ncbi:MAG: YbaK/EbsC family protein [Thermoanaerobaculia bacterium]|nr:YbaK/EbsC family protein [Thermoanaerobaculia bacterium]